jgi:hypothetical protein
MKSMPQAKTAYIRKPAITPTTALIAAHRRAVASERAAEEEWRSWKWPNHPSVIVPEIGANCVVYEPQELTRLAQEHIDNSGMDGVSRIAFRSVVEGYREVLTTLIALRAGWRKTSGADAAEERWGAASEAADAAWESLLARAMADPKSIPDIAAYFSKVASAMDTWRLRALLKIVAAGKAVRK